MEPKPPALLLALVETVRLRWFVAYLGLNGQTVPLLASAVNDLERYRRLTFDDQVAFLRHRFCGALQRGCDRLWAHGHKACQFVFIFESPLDEPTGQLTQAVADHFTQWMLNPPVVVFVSTDGFDPGGAPRLEKLAGEIEAPQAELLHAHLGTLLAARRDLSLWESVPPKKAKEEG